LGGPSLQAFDGVVAPEQVGCAAGDGGQARILAVSFKPQASRGSTTRAPQPRPAPRGRRSSFDSCTRRAFTLTLPLS
jgi:hypothetical protein